MKFVFGVCVLVLTMAMVAPETSNAQFNKGKMFLGPAIDLGRNVIGLGAQFEVGISDNIGIGGIARYWGDSETFSSGESSWSLIVIQATGYYHFMPGQNLDPYVGARLGYAVYDFSFDSNIPGYSYTGGGESGLFLNGAGGLRYFFNRSIAINGSLEFRLAGEKYFDDDLAFLVGVDFLL